MKDSEQNETVGPFVNNYSESQVGDSRAFNEPISGPMGNWNPEEGSDRSHCFFSSLVEIVNAVQHSQTYSSRTGFSEM